MGQQAWVLGSQLGPTSQKKKKKKKVPPSKVPGLIKGNGAMSN